MKEYFKIAWRNLWRNKRRTLLTIASVLFALLLALIVRSMHLGTWNKMIESTIKSTTGYIQVHQEGYWEDKTLDNSFETSSNLEQKYRSHPNVTYIVPKLESFALLSSGNQTKGAALTGVDPDVEDLVSGLQKKIIAGKYFTTDDKFIILTEGLANYLKLTVGDTVVILGQGYHGVTAAAALPIGGIVKFTQPDMNNLLTYVPLSLAQEIYSAPGRLTSISFILNDPEDLDRTRNDLAALGPQNLEVMPWKDLLTELVQSFEGDNVSGLFMLGILYLVVGFGILGTILMTTMERKREFGIMTAVGMRRYKLSIIIVIETLIISFIGILSGVILSLPVIYYFHLNPLPLKGEAADAMAEYNMDPVMPFLLEPGFIINQSMVVMIISMLTLLYPLVVINRFKIINAIKGR
ncbi:MAG TPA: FtsX-like permease family protein [Bacteroidales bacterium]|nr:FtsX-like permease family protein [Bacteroidales bacterium]HPM91984.1 FtsX-like permease family protein [Bacteroidales bacterium]